MTTRVIRFRSAAIGLTVACTFSASATVTFFDFLLDGSQEVTPADTDAFGFATLEYDSSVQTFNIDVFTDGIGLIDLAGAGPNDTSIHLHLAPRGQNGPIVVDLGLVGDFSDLGGGILNFSALDVSIGGPQGFVPDSDPNLVEEALFAGNLYLNIHTVDFPGGEIRGQVVPSPSAPICLTLAGLAAARRRR